VADRAEDRIGRPQGGDAVSEPGVIGDVRQLLPKVYLGDAVYARVDEFGAVILTTENGVRATNVITLEPEVMAALAAFYKRAMAATPHDSTERTGDVELERRAEVGYTGIRV